MPQAAHSKVKRFPPCGQPLAPAHAGHRNPDGQRAAISQAAQASSSGNWRWNSTSPNVHVMFLPQAPALVTPHRRPGAWGIASTAEFNALGARLGLNMTDEGDRFRARREIAHILEPWFHARTLAEVARIFEKQRVTWAPYWTVRVSTTTVSDGKSAIVPVFCARKIDGGPRLS